MTPSEIINAILQGRGIVGDAAVFEFLSDSPQLIHDPFLLEDMHAGVTALLAAIADGRRICIYGDYDVDGVCGTAMLCRYLSDIGGNDRIVYYIPSRIEEGYGLNKEALASIHDGSVFPDGIRADLVLTVDCGSVSVSEVDFAHEIGLEIIITDHHDLAKTLAPDCIHINPKRGEYPFKGLCGAAVAFKLCCAIEEMREKESGKEKVDKSIFTGLIDFVCVATIADVMSLVDENRTLVKYGLRTIRRKRRLALNVLFQVAGIDPGSATVRDIAFGIAPRINAAGRLSNAADAVELFLTEDESHIQEIASRIDRLNTERRNIQDECYKECMVLYESAISDNGDGPQFLMLKPKLAHEGVAGIVAGKIRESTGFPCAVLSETKEGELKGSARSVGRLDLTAFLRGRSEYFLQLGGHSAAAGFTLRKEDESLLRECLASDLLALVEADPDLLNEEELIDLNIESLDIDFELAEALESLAPFGQGNPLPALAFYAPAGSISSIKKLGAGRVHVRFQIDGLECIWFSGAEALTLLIAGSPEEEIEIIGHPEVNKWNGRKSLQLVVSIARKRGLV